MKCMHSFLKFCFVSCLVLLISGCVVLSDDENVPGSDPADVSDVTDAADASDPTDTTDAADSTDAADEADASEASDASDPSSTNPECSEDTPCAAGLYCAEGECVPQETDGTACSDEGMCASGFCVDGVCCESACDGVCQTCLSPADFENTGECRSHESGTDPESECAPQMCNGEGACFAGEAGSPCSQDYECGGELVCNENTCAENICGDGEVRGTEECDDANDSNFDACLNTCETAECGDGFTWPANEECDDSGESQSCNADCTLSACGDGITNSTAGELCDGAGESAECNLDCTFSECGDGITNVSAGEICDENGIVVTYCNYGLESCELCDIDCNYFPGITSYCGDGNTNEGYESCDDGNTEVESCNYGETACQVCDESCQEVAGATSYCGDSNIDAGNNENCDDGNSLTEECDYGATSCTVCNDNCVEVAGETSYCGDSTIDPTHGENCDDGNAITETCDYGETSCTVCNENCVEVPGATSYCGDNIIDTDNNENCDHAGNIDLDCPYAFNQEDASCEVCNDQCVIQAGQEHYCGDNMNDASEQCDTGGDSAQCDRDCTIVSCGDGYTNTVADEECDHAGDFNLNCDYAFNEAPCTKCNASCREVPGITHFCGDGAIDSENGEVCDEGSFSTAAGTDLYYGCPACQSTVCAGDFVVTSSANNGIDDCNVIDGDLTIQAFYMDCTFCTPADYDFDQIYRVTGSLKVIPQTPAGLGWADGLRKLNLDNLRTIGQNFEVARYGLCIGMDCTYHENEQLLELSLQRLEQISNTFTINYNPLLNKFWIPALQQTGSLNITYNPTLCVDEDSFGRDPWAISYSGQRSINNNKSTGCD